MDYFGRNIDFFQFWTLFERVFALWGTFFGQIVKTEFYASGRKLWGNWSVSKFLFIQKPFRALGKNSQDFKKKLRTGFSKVHIYVSGRPSWAKRTRSEIFFYINRFRHWAKHFSTFDKTFHAWLSKLHFLWPSIVFRKLFLRTNFCSTFIGFGWNISKLLVKNF